jgi:very-short-patch-repair endonuclease
MKKHPTHGAHARARALRHGMTKAERRIWQILRSRQVKGHRFRRQVPIGRYIADFVCHEGPVDRRVDGGQYDRSSCREAARTAFLQSEGYRILRFWNDEILANLDGVHHIIGDSLVASPPPSPPPSRGRV